MLGLASADDAVVWAYAAAHGLTIVSKDADFHQLSFLRGAPPKAVWIRRGNCSTDDIERILRGQQADLLTFEEAEAAFLIID
jgi:predicted nuclease of predicted toxin-antitoxin system